MASVTMGDLQDSETTDEGELQHQCGRRFTTDGLDGQTRELATQQVPSTRRWKDQLREKMDYKVWKADLRIR